MRFVGRWAVLTGAALLATGLASSEPVGTAFTYQGHLVQSGLPANGLFDMEFRLYDADSGGGQVGGTQTAYAVSVGDGYFAVDLDFGPSVFTGEALWLDIAVRRAGGGVFTPLSPRQPVRPTPYSQQAANADTVDGLHGADLLDRVTYDPDGDGTVVAADTAATATNADLLDGLHGASFVLKAGDTMAGALTLAGDPVQPLEAATKQYVDSAAGGGGIPSGSMILRDSETPPSGFTYTGYTIVADEGNYWTCRPSDLPSGRGWRISSGCATVSGKVYCVGGDSTTGTPWAETWEYDPASDTWTAKAPPLTAHKQGHVVAALGNMVYVIGGQDASSTYLDVNEVYDPATDSWSSRAPLPAVRAQASWAVVDGKIYVISGSDGSAVVATNLMYDPVADSWTTRAPLPVLSERRRATAVGTKVYVFEEETVRIYDTLTDGWSVGAEKTAGAAIWAAIPVNERIFLVGIYPRSSAPISVQEYDPAHELCRWRADGASEGSYPGVCASGEIIYTIGGFLNNDEPTPEVCEYAVPKHFYVHVKN